MSQEYHNYVLSLPKKRMGAGVLIRDKEGKILMVVPTYKDNFEIPGGVVEANESPLAACKREVQEELGLNLTVGRLLCVDYYPTEYPLTESLMFVFDGGVLTEDEIALIKTNEQELKGFVFLNLNDIEGKTSNSLFKRIVQAIKAVESGEMYYLELGINS